jgi:hypothetical protein
MLLGRGASKDTWRIDTKLGRKYLISSRGVSRNCVVRRPLSAAEHLYVMKGRVNICVKYSVYLDGEGVALLDFGHGFSPGFFLLIHSLHTVSFFLLIFFFLLLLQLSFPFNRFV